MAQKITPNIWFEGNAREAVEFYISIFPGSSIIGGSKYPSSADEGLADFQINLAGKDLTVDFKLADHYFSAINAGPEFKPNALNSFMVNFDPSRDGKAHEHIDEVWQKLIDGGEALMPIDKYDFSERYGWVRDRYGFTWQLILTDSSGDDRPCIIPSFMFGDGVQNRANEAIEYYVSVFKNSKRGLSYPYGQPTVPATAEALMFADFTLENQWFVANDSGVKQDFTFTEAVSFVITCKDQEEINYYWEKLSKNPENEQCGWCKDQFGVSWQIVPENIEELMKIPGAFSKMMEMHKIEMSEF
ncbi:MAG: VOC family protein [bacterium]|nr:VOC family protein [bacterium]